MVCNAQESVYRTTGSGPFLGQKGPGEITHLIAFHLQVGLGGLKVFCQQT